MRAGEWGNPPPTATIRAFPTNPVEIVGRSVCWQSGNPGFVASSGLVIAGANDGESIGRDAEYLPEFPTSEMGPEVALALKSALKHILEAAHGLRHRHLVG